jgi:CheY-like chemotaxis protein
MNTNLKHLPVILLVDRTKSSCMPAREWLQESRFRMWEAMNVFEALEGISDFTLRSRPDVILVNVESVRDDFQLLAALLLHGDLNELEYPVFALSESASAGENSEIYEGDLTQITAKLEEIVPKTSAAAN